MEKPRIDNDHEFSPVYDSIKERAAKKQGRCLFLVVNLTILLASAFAVLYFVLPTFSSAGKSRSYHRASMVFSFGNRKYGD